MSQPFDESTERSAAVARHGTPDPVREVIIAEYDPAWPKMFDAESARIREALGRVGRRVEHIGSTSVPGLGAKPIIDIMVTVDSFEPMAPYRAPLERLGYMYRADEDPDHRFFKRDVNGIRTFQIHVMRSGEQWEWRHRAFRDHLRADREAARAYERLKRELAEIHRFDVSAYAEAKTPFIRTMEQHLRNVAGDPDDPIEIVPYDPHWPEMYEEEANRIRAVLGDVAERIEHVGSTAVRGLSAKPVIDIQVSLPDVSAYDRYVGPLERIGYEFRPDPAESEHEFFLRRDDGRRRYHVHVCPTGSDWEWRHIAFRDRLRSDPGTARRYESVKRELAERYRSDRLGYVEAKTNVVLEIETQIRRERGEPTRG